ncbi:MAG TPA: isoleucine--tRNA ligase [Candidatus Paceibacterota bacterium]|nr:isoleucine--tRNA ligase [Candidatus Paceibacterota bacterium]HPT40486.1 isoleucine--tRNA ligase [Candidatus Paceibacterota bacterium]
MASIKEIEENLIKYWEEKQIFEKTLQKDSPEGEYVFYDGPPFATGTPHYGHLVASTMKDAVPRYWTMRGYHVARRWGWDCHGLPIENIVEKELGFKSKKDIEDFGIDKFNENCRSKVLKYTEEWERVIHRLGRWVDMEHSYKTMDLSYMESVWWVFKSLWDKGLIYEGYKSMHICPRCETTLSQQEVSEGYQNIKDISVTAKFELKNPEKLGFEEKTYVLAWTTTPWTLPGNVALAINSRFDYILIKAKGYQGDFVLAKDRLEFLGVEAEIIKEFKGSELEGLKYEPLFPYYLENNDIPHKENLYSIVSADFVSLEDGTGVVHIAPAYGEEDMLLGQEKNLPMIQNVTLGGKFESEVKDFPGLSVKPIDDTKKTDRLIIEYLKNKDLLFKEQEFEHSYPHCWRCDTPLINYATSSWFVNVSKIKEKAIELAKDINWSPNHIKEGRFGKWLEGARDWSISRQRFWASVIPIWKCECDEEVVFGSIQELETASGVKVVDLHKHFIDKIEVPCKKCGKMMKRVPDVLDTWFDSGSMPYAQEHYPFENREKFDKNFPAQFIAEGIDQTRAWFYYLHIIATAIKEKPAFQNVIVNGIVLTESGKKMSKHLNNYTDPTEIMNKYGSDALRFYLLSSPVVAAENLSFSDDGVKEMVQKIVMLLHNILRFYQPYQLKDIPGKPISDVPLDIWIVSRLHQLGEEVTRAMEKYDLPKATRPFIQFINEFSTWWLRLSRNRFKSENVEDKNMATATFGYVLLFLSKLLAPFTPFVAEYIYQGIGGKKESVHLEDWPFQDNLVVDYDVLKKMEATQKAVEIGLALRATANMKIRQPLNKIILKDKEVVELLYVDLVKQELNIKNVELGTEDVLDLVISDELKVEGLVRELTRSINQLRKDSELTISDTNVSLKYETASELLKQAIDKNKEEIKKSCLCGDIVEGNFEAKEIIINGEKIKMRLSK